MKLQLIMKRDTIYIKHTINIEVIYPIIAKILYVAYM